jgi:dipeptidyl aminopeptidase/acylaminoacyl peptidase
VWLDPALAAVQKTINGADPNRTWEIVEWDQGRSAFLVRGTSQSEPGVYAVFQPEENALSEFTSRAPWLSETDRNPGRSFQFESKTHGMLSGYLTLPRHPTLKKPPLVVLCHDGPWARNYPGYDRDAQALATMGFIVLQVNYRGSVGFGRRHLDALRAGIDRVAAEDIAEALDVMAPPEVDRRLIAIMGQGYGGYVALRALQLYPERFRCGVVLDAITDLDIWANPASDGPSFEGEVRRQFLATDTSKHLERAIATHADLIKAPVFVIEADDNFRLGGHDLAGRLARQNADTRFLGLDANEAAPLPQARAALYGKIQDFLNTNVYNYAVKIGALKTVEQK